LFRTSLLLWGWSWKVTVWESELNLSREQEWGIRCFQNIHGESRINVQDRIILPWDEPDLLLGIFEKMRNLWNVYDFVLPTPHYYNFQFLSVGMRFVKAYWEKIRQLTSKHRNQPCAHFGLTSLTRSMSSQKIITYYEWRTHFLIH
jgi:hypothetical protein